MRPANEMRVTGAQPESAEQLFVRPRLRAG